MWESLQTLLKFFARKHNVFTEISYCNHPLHNAIFTIIILNVESFWYIKNISAADSFRYLP